MEEESFLKKITEFVRDNMLGIGIITAICFVGSIIWMIIPMMKNSNSPASYNSDNNSSSTSSAGSNGPTVVSSDSGVSNDEQVDKALVSPEAKLPDEKISFNEISAAIGSHKYISCVGASFDYGTFETSCDYKNVMTTRMNPLPKISGKQLSFVNQNKIDVRTMEFSLSTGKTVRCILAVHYVESFGSHYLSQTPSLTCDW